MPQNPPSPRRRRGFTLIELLTVIAIIGILAAIIIPTVAKVRESARKAQTTSNMRQVGMAVASFLADNKDLMPYARQGKGLQPSVHPVARMLAAGHDGSGDWSDPGSRLGSHIAPYVGIKAAVDTDINISVLQDDAWRIQVAGKGVNPDTYWTMPSFVLNPGLSRAFHPSIAAATIFPWGKDSTTPANVSSAGNYVKVLSQIGAPSRVWGMIQNDRQLLTDSNGIITNGMSGANSPDKPVYGNSRLALMFDWSVRPIPTSHDLRRPL